MQFENRPQHIMDIGERRRRKLRALTRGLEIRIDLVDVDRGLGRDQIGEQLAGRGSMACEMRQKVGAIERSQALRKGQRIVERNIVVERKIECRRLGGRTAQRICQFVEEARVEVGESVVRSLDLARRSGVGLLSKLKGLAHSPLGGRGIDAQESKRLREKVKVTGRSRGIHGHIDKKYSAGQRWSPQ
ncbi:MULTISPECIES: hypothetical protein [Bradyrhizobium]|uniref:hypothetical protein n=1 Tax=Bradyrhizobium TaxID=374 RepID=UPI001FE4F768|nr:MULTISPECIES: hypothetical protein [Bradyrhizobium]MCL8485485.1 hypothetical protein [Bradyrhizobium denitrificans]MDU1491015.1 hypothetical protein [Bradyrhizobium sp.]MDU1541193.1 hypothetical protein [Bradyrhizobium sp.]MDU1807471.1 hypothetical protein [Bradyrhizobium sp.]MDU2921393.1 hypothetical protein [Bradyrhizobium sp.]